MTLSGWDIPVFVFDPNAQMGHDRLTPVNSNDLLNGQPLPEEDDHVWLLEVESGLNGPGVVEEVFTSRFSDGRLHSWYAMIRVDWSQLTLAEECDEENS